MLIYSEFVNLKNPNYFHLTLIPYFFRGNKECNH